MFNRTKYYADKYKNDPIFRDKMKGYVHKWQVNNPEKVKKHNQEYSKTEKFRNISATYTKNSWKKIRDDIFNIIGNSCIICGMKDRDCLQIDHINDDGAEHRRKYNASLGKNGLYRSLLLDTNIKNIVQPLCANCNWKKQAIRRELLWLGRRNLPPF